MATTQLNKEGKEPAYRRFVSDQVLTASQLNDVVDHFERQDRLSRICLSGVGIVCGLQVRYNEETSIEVTKGCALTTDGDLVSFKGAVFTNARVFEDTQAKYDRFTGIPLLELMTDDEAEVSGVESLDTVSNLATMVAVLYVEYYATEETPCTSTDCDAQGEEQAAKVRILLISKENARRISNADNDPIFDKHNNTKKYIDLPEIDIKRVILQNSYITNANGEEVISQNSNTADYIRLKESYRKVIQETGVLAQLKNGVNKLFTDFARLLETDSLEIKSANINKKIDELYNFNAKNVPLDIQYRYDVLLDLLDTYKEIKCLIFDVRAVCCPDVDAFPKHLLLAELEPVESYLQCRHSFYPSPIIPHGKEKLEKIRALLLRFHFMVTEYGIPQSTTSIKVTPSKKCDKALGDRSIPYYFATTSSLVEHWNHEKTNKFASGENLGYRTANLSERDAVQNPLDYDICTNDFYRVEGHLGKDYRTALADLDAIKTEKSLPFEIKVLSIDESLDSIDTSDYECEFEDLNAVLKAWRAEQDCLNASISGFFSGFSLKDPGIHKYYTLQDVRKVSGAPAAASAKATSATGSKSTNTRTIGSLLEPRTKLLGDLKLDTAALKINFQNLIYKRDTVIEDNLKTDEDVLGNFVEKALKEKSEGSAVDIAAIVKTEIDKDPEIANWDKEVRKVALEQPYEILAYTKVATRDIPNNVSEITFDRIDRYDITVRNLCDRVETFKKSMTSLLFNKESSYVRKGYEEQYALLLNQLSVNCCAAEKMKVLLAEVQERKRKILELKLLSKFVEKHSGLEHKAGVEPGGTFVMVYKGRTVATRAVTGLTDLISKTNLSIDSIKNVFERGTLTTNVGKEKIDITKLDPKVGIDIRDIGLIDVNLLDELLFRPIANITENTVVADFALPYICCSDCSPVAFIVPKTTVSLRLPQDFVCLDEDTTPLPFEVSPVDGIVAADVGDGLIGGVVQTDGKFFFDASLISEELLGQEIKFTVNGQFTDAKITVFRKPVFDFTSSEPRLFKDNTVARVNFTVQGDELPEDATYFWDFGDDTLPDNNTDKNPEHVYILPVNEENTVTVSLTVTSGKCSTTETKDISFGSFALKENQVCLGDVGIEVGFSVTPEDALVATTEEFKGLTIEKEVITIDPASFDKFGTPIGFTVNGISTTETLTVNPIPKAIFTADQVGDVLELANISENASSYIWTVNGTITNRTNKLGINIPLNADSPRTFVVSLQARSESCGSDIDGPRTITVETGFASFALKENQVCLGDIEIEVGFSVTPGDALVATTEKIEGLTIEKEVITIDPAAFAKFDTPISFTVNGIPTTETLTVIPMPKAVFSGEQVDGQLVLSNTSENASSYIWTVNGEITNRANRLAIRIPLNADSPRIFVVSLEARSESCGSHLDGPRTITVEREGVEANCTEKTTVRVKSDSELLRRLNMQGSNIIEPLWTNTVEQYQEVLNNLEEYSSGKKNGDLQKLFQQPLETTASLIMEIGTSKEEGARALQIFETQLQLFYNVLGCQNEDQLSSSSEIKALLEGTVQIKRQFKEQSISFSKNYKNFGKEYIANSVDADTPTLNNHFEIIKREKLI